MPDVKILGSGSDHAPFAFLAGIPSICLSTQPDMSVTGVNYYPAYHTGYETFHLVDQVINNSKCNFNALYPNRQEMKFSF